MYIRLDDHRDRRARGFAWLLAALAASAVFAAGSASFLHAATRSPDQTAFVGDFETGPPGWQQFDGLQYEEDRPLADSFAHVADPVRQGRHAVRVTARQGYSKFGYNESTQLVWRGGEREGDEYWYAWSALFPDGWTAPLRWGIFAEWHANLDTSPIISLTARADSASATLLSGTADERQNSATVDRVVPLLSTLTKGRWNDFVMHVRWTVHPQGVVEIYHRVAGEAAFRKLVGFENVPTFQQTAEGRGLGAYLLFGLYRASYCPQPTDLSCSDAQGNQQPNTLYLDNFVRAGSYASVVTRAFPGQAPALATAGRAVQQEGSRVANVAPRWVRPAGKQVESGCSVAVTGGGILASVDGASSARDSGVVLYRIGQRRATIVRQQVQVQSRPRGKLVVTSVQDRRERTLAQLYTDARGTLRLSSPKNALRPRGFDVDTGIAAGPIGDTRAVELRLMRHELWLVTDGRLVVRLTNLVGPRSGQRLTVRLGIDSYEGRAGSGPIRVVQDTVSVGTS